MTRNWNYIMAVIAAVFIVVAGVVLLTTNAAGEFAPFGWLLIVIGLLSLAANAAIRMRLP